MNKLTALILFLALISCSDGKIGITIEIKNSSDKTVRHVAFSSDANTKLEFEKIKPNQTVTKFFDMSKNQKGDGSFFLRFERENGKTEQTYGGYYTNGAPMDRKAACEIKNDTIMMNFRGY